MLKELSDTDIPSFGFLSFDQFIMVRTCCLLVLVCQ